MPLRAGGRVTGRVGRFSLGLINIQADEVEEAGVAGTNFSVVRLKRDILRRSAVGVMATGRSVDSRGGGANYAYGLDSTFGFYDNLTINTYWARTQSEGLSDDDVSYRAQFDYNADRYGVELERLGVGANFNPEVGFTRRRDLRRNFGRFRFSPRPAGIALVRQLNWTASINYIENGAGVLETREQTGSFEAELANDDTTSVTYTRSYEFLPEPFQIARGVTLPVGDYQLRRRAGVLQHGAAAAGPSKLFGQPGQLLQRSQDDGRRLRRGGAGEQPLLDPAQLLAEPRGSGRRQLHHPLAEHAGHLCDVVPIVRERAGAIQLE